jgi:hypothetical protein
MSSKRSVEWDGCGGAKGANEADEQQRRRSSRSKRMGVEGATGTQFSSRSSRKGRWNGMGVEGHRWAGNYVEKLSKRSVEWDGCGGHGRGRSKNTSPQEPSEGGGSADAGELHEGTT